MAKRRLGEAVEDDVVRRVVGSADFLQDHMLFALQLVGVEFRIGQYVGENIDGERDVVTQNAGVEGCRLDAGRGIDLAADILDFRSDLPGTAFAGTLERHVFEQMGHAMLVLTLVPRAGLDPDTEGNGFDLRKGFGGDCQAVRQTAYLNTHVRFTP